MTMESKRDHKNLCRTINYGSDWQGQVVSIASGKLVALLIDSNEKHSPQQHLLKGFGKCHFSA